MRTSFDSGALEKRIRGFAVEIGLSESEMVACGEISAAMSMAAMQITTRLAICGKIDPTKMGEITMKSAAIMLKAMEGFPGFGLPGEAA